jgi:flagellar hook-associated protein 3 FlgL
MRVTSNTYTNLVISSSQQDQQQLANLEQQVSSGNTVQFASDNPGVYSQAASTQTTIAELNGYTSAAATATSLTSANNSAMTSLHSIISQASELATTVTSNMSSADMQSIATQMSSLLSQLTSTVNQTYEGNYLFGGTSNQPPIDSTTNAYNTATNGATTSLEIQPGNSVQTGIAAGRSGSPPVDGFLYDSATNTDVLGSLKQTITDLNNGDATAVQSTDVTALNSSLNLISQYVGSTAANMSAVSTATTALSQQTTSADNHLNALTQTDLATASIQLQQIQNQYQASLEAGTRLMNLSILNYMSTVGTG